MESKGTCQEIAPSPGSEAEVAAESQILLLCLRLEGEQYSGYHREREMRSWLFRITEEPIAVNRHFA